MKFISEMTAELQGLNVKKNPAQMALVLPQVFKLAEYMTVTIENLVTD
jgi:hypothetical protein